MISNLTIAKKLILLLLTKMLLLALFALWVLVSKYMDYTNLSELERHVKLSSLTSKVVHELQKERGMTAGFLGSNGVNFKNEIKQQRKSSDNAYNELLNYIKNTKVAENIKIKYSIPLKALENKAQIRTDINNLDIDLTKALGYYTNINDLMLRSIIDISKTSNSKIISQQLNGYINFLLSKERAGIERAIGTNALSSKEFSRVLQQKYISLIAEQNAYLENFLSYATTKSISLYKSKINHPSFKKVQKIRNQLLVNNFQTESSLWFTTITKKINTLKQIDDYLSDALIEAILEEKNNAFSMMLLVIAISIIGWLLVIVLAYLVTTDLTNKMDKFKEGLLQFFAFARRESDTIELVDINSKDEFGQMAIEINNNITSSKNSILQDQKFVDEVKQVVSKVNNGLFNHAIINSPSNESLNELKELLNEMLTTLTSNVSDDLNKITNTLEKFQHLDFRHRIKECTGKTSIGLNKLADIINEMLLENKKNGTLLNSSAQSLLGNISTLNTSSNEAAASLEETAAALEQITGNSSSNTENIVKMASFAKELTHSANKGEILAKETTVSMDEINEEVSSISEAIAVIDQIAFQTNILSLNAAVEAATAGEAGKGFAVVAQEVRNLASRSAEAANEIKTLVENATSKASNGKGKANEMISGYNNLNENIAKTLDLINDIESSSQEQLNGINQINNAVTSLDQQTQKNANVASQAQDIANATTQIATNIVEDANKKEFIGKDNIM